MPRRRRPRRHRGWSGWRRPPGRRSSPRQRWSPWPVLEVSPGANPGPTRDQRPERSRRRTRQRLSGPQRPVIKPMARTVPTCDRTDAEAFAEPTDDTPGEVVLGAGSRADASEATGSSDADEVPGNEQALPMAWSPGMTPPDPGERTGPLHGDTDDEDLVPEPDPTWPKLFGQSSEPREAGAPAEVAGGAHATASVYQDRRVGRRRAVGRKPHRRRRARPATTGRRYHHARAQRYS